MPLVSVLIARRVVSISIRRVRTYTPVAPPKKARAARFSRFFWRGFRVDKRDADNGFTKIYCVRFRSETFAIYAAGTVGVPWPRQQPPVRTAVNCRRDIGIPSPRARRYTPTHGRRDNARNDMKKTCVYCTHANTFSRCSASRAQRPYVATRAPDRRTSACNKGGNFPKSYR